MRPPARQLLSARPFGWVLLLCLALVYGGCGLFSVLNKTPPPVPQSHWKELTGQVQYRDAKRSFVADVTIRTDAEGHNYSMEITKAGANLLKLDRRNDLGWARGPAAGLPFAGKIAVLPTHLKRWFAAADAAIQSSLSGAKKSPAPPAKVPSDVKIYFRLQS